MSAHKHKKRKGNVREELQATSDTSKPSAVFTPTKGRQHTLSIALPGSIIAKYVKGIGGRKAKASSSFTNFSSALTHDQKTALAGQIARACAVFCVDEIVIFDDGQADSRPPEHDGYTAYSDPNFFLFHILSYLETPPHLRKRLFPMHPDLRTAGSLPSLDMPHHLRSDEWCPYREGIVVNTAVEKQGSRGVNVDCGLSKTIFLGLELENNTRVTLKLQTSSGDSKTSAEGEAISPMLPREEAGYYWGYSVRQASSLSSVFTECPFDGGYDVSIGTSERGAPCETLLDPNCDEWEASTWMHLLVVFGGVAGLEPALSVDPALRSSGIKEVKEVFDHWINLVPGQGSRTIRTEEAIWIGLVALRPLINSRDVD